MAREKKIYTPDEERARYEKHRDEMRQRAAEQSAAGRDIGEIPAVVNPARRESCRENFLLFLSTYFPATFTKPFSASQPKVAAIMQTAALDGGSYAWCMTRGGAKTTFCEKFAEWVTLYGHSRFFILAGASKAAATDSFNAIKNDLESNDLLLEDFPEVCYPVRRLEHKPQRAPTMLLDRKPIAFEWSKEQLVFPNVPGSISAGTIIRALGYGGRLRGQKHNEDRPDCVVLDDIQKDKTAKNPQNVTEQLTLLKSVIEGMKGRGKPITILVPGTRLNANCFMSRLMDRKKYPEYQGRIFKAMKSFPKNLDLWHEYRKVMLEKLAEIWEEDADSETAIQQARAAATRFYLEHRAEMDDGAEVDWPEMFDPWEVSGIQNLMNIFLDDEGKFWAEYQNEPKAGLSGGKLDEELLLTKVMKDIPRRVVPRGTTSLTLGCDVQKEMVFWMVVAWQKGFTGHIIAYGTVPTQSTLTFTAENPPVPLSSLYPDQTLEARLYFAIDALIEEVLQAQWPTEDGGTFTIEHGLIDANWEESRDTVFTAINRHFRDRYYINGSYRHYPLLPSRGRGTSGRGAFGRKSRRDVEEEAGTQFSYLARPASPEEPVGTVWINTNKVKSYALARLLAPVGAPGSLTIHGATPGFHTLLFDHLTSEYPVPATEGELSFDKWKMKPSRYENHWWDCLCLAIVANAMAGQRLSVHDAPDTRPLYVVDEEGVS